MTAFQVGGTTVIGTSREITLGTATPGSPATGMIRYNSSGTQFEVYNGSAWVAVITAGGSGSVSLWGWGTNRAIVGAPYNIDLATGIIGDFTNVNKSSPVSVVGGFEDWSFITSSLNGAFALRANGTAWSWGVAISGELGNGFNASAAYRSSPTSILGGFTDWIQLSCTYATLGLRANGSLWSWGRNQYGQIGDGTVTYRSSPVSVLGGFTDWTQVSTGARHSLAIRANGTAWAWGQSSSGQLGIGLTGGYNKSSPVSVVGGFTDWAQVAGGSNFSLGIRANGTLWSWGYNSYGQLGNNGSGYGTNRSSPSSVVGGFTDWTQVAARGTHAAGIRANGTLWTWGANSGNNYAGSLGLNDTVNRSSPSSVVGGFTDWTQVSVAAPLMMGIRANGTAWSWGQNAVNLQDAFKGMLGDGTIIDRSSPVSILGGYTDWVQITCCSVGGHGLRAV